MKNLTLLVVCGFLATILMSCEREDYNCSCYCLSGGTGEYSGTASFMKGHGSVDAAEDKCVKDADKTGQSCAVWTCYATLQ